MTLDVKPTRSELIKLKRRINLAESGHKLLKKKRDGLILEFFRVLKNARTLRRELNEKYLLTKEKMTAAIALDGMAEIKSAAMALKERPAVDLEVKNIMGVKVPEIKSNARKKSLFERGYGLISMSLRIEEMIDAYEDLLISVIRAAEVETTLRKLLMEIEKTKRRVNALEFAVIPKLKSQAEFITFRLEEMERENIFRMKRIKEK
ncbi:MAG: V-type ATP synthase subunit D [Candidatus Aenigmatarchaeota archaeon]|nr:MAG: V-type ATP synthase subunit D [Candidatus Aenigmarchaeota archaeon]RLJ08034.1 MAG: V-type ATP synthase subunit D [Candidatus Aenigmarchaeota archaeon]RLJ08645.1 MAG: V-type ATP synthase subunit D [Candidatus Aenigmarchaeota archaeon]